MARKTYSRLKQIISRTGLGKSSIYSLIKQGKFPQQIHLSTRTAVWDDDEVDSWLAARAAESRKKNAA